MDVFQNIAGYQQEKQEIKELIDILSNKSKYKKLGVTIPNGILLSGTPGNGKTLFANSMLEVLNKNVVTIGPEEVYGNVSTQIKNIYKTARESKNETIIYIDELDTLVMEDHGQFEGMNNKVVSQLLKELDLTQHSNVFTILVSNRPYNINPALLRSGRVDIKIDFKLPNKKNRKEVLQYYLNNHTYSNYDLDNLVSSTKGLSCSDLQNVVSKAILFSLRDNRETISQDDFEEAISRIAFSGLGRDSEVSDKTLRRVAYHEIGHGIITYMTDCNNFGSVTLVNWGKSLGHHRVRFVNTEVLTEEQYINQMAVTIGGRTAEDIEYATTSTLSSSDLSKFSKMATQAVKNFGFNNVFLVSDSDDFMIPVDSSKKTEKIEEMMEMYMEMAINKSYEILMEHKEQLDTLVDLLLKKKTLYLSDFKEIFEK